MGVKASYSQPVPAAAVILGLVGVLGAMLIGCAALPGAGGRAVVTITNGAIGLVAALTGGYAHLRARGATQTGLSEFAAVLGNGLDQKGAPQA